MSPRSGPASGLSPLSSCPRRCWQLIPEPSRGVRAARDHGVLVRALVTSVAVSPPLTVQHDHLSLIGESLAHAFDAPPRPMAGTR
jgi:putrescine---pyruvate transaminase